MPPSGSFQKTDPDALPSGLFQKTDPFEPLLYLLIYLLRMPNTYSSECKESLKDAMKGMLVFHTGHFKRLIPSNPFLQYICLPSQNAKHVFLRVQGVSLRR